MPKISVIIPVYNAEQFLLNCLESIITQTFNDIEIICVDDGSTDNSINILNEYAKKDLRLKIITQKNQYAGIARNNGMSIASGDYLFFMDADDSVLDRTAFSKIYEDIEKNNYPQIIRFKAKAYDLYKQKIFSLPSLEMSDVPEVFFKKVFSPLESNYIQVINKIEPAPWLGMIRRDFVINNKLTFNSQRCHNDSSFMWCSFVIADKIIFSNQYCTLYKTNDSNSLQGKRSKSYDAILGNIDSIRDFCSKRNIKTINANYIILRELRNLIRACESDVVFRNNGYENLKTTINYIKDISISIYDGIEQKEDYEYSSFCFIKKLSKYKYNSFVHTRFFIRTFIKFSIRKLKLFKK